ncbi:unnamed protein product, partial [Schistocephalus solidus]|uniref:PARP catalytic domain-containing protein n=1 Tax=Schistocephalus solidus TaxID=70667 RepID=A0A183TTH6_SCHSO
EEVFAESYDEEGAATQTRIDKPASTTLSADLKKISSMPVIENGILVYECADCPNQANPYHDCVAYCFERYGRRTFHTDQRLGRLRDRMLRRYPLPSHWLEVGDPATQRYGHETSFFYAGVVDNNNLSYHSIFALVCVECSLLPVADFSPRGVGCCAVPTRLTYLFWLWVVGRKKWLV